MHTAFTFAFFFISTCVAISVRGIAEGFASDVTGGGLATPVFPKTNAELAGYLKDTFPRVIVLTKVFDFTGTEGKVKATGCAPWGTKPACQLAINLHDWCKKRHPKAKSVPVEYDKAGILGLTVRSDKTILGRGKGSGLKGKGLRIVHGAKNVIIQNVAITDINSQYVWGGDAITLDGSDLVWIDRVTIKRIGRQHIVAGPRASGRVTISNSFFDGRTKYSATCNGYHYWGLFFTGENDLVTMKGNFIYHMSGRSPKVSGNTIVHVVNNYFYDNPDHAMEVSGGGNVLLEANLFRSIKNVLLHPVDAHIFSSPDIKSNQVCNAYLGRPCMINGYRASTGIAQVDIGFMDRLKGKQVAAATRYKSVQCLVKMTAGQRWYPFMPIIPGPGKTKAKEVGSLPDDGFEQCPP